MLCFVKLHIVFYPFLKKDYIYTRKYHSLAATTKQQQNFISFFNELYLQFMIKNNY